MFGNLTFTLYEVMGYLLPGGTGLLGIILIYWSLFVPTTPLGIATFQPGLLTWVAIGFSSYLLGHALQAASNLLLKGDESLVLGSFITAPWLRDRANELASKLLGISHQDLTGPWAFRALDEYVVHAGEPGDREMFTYREGFYRGTSISLFFLTLSLIVRAVVPGTALKFSHGVFYISTGQILITALITSAAGRLFIRRYQRFFQYRVTRAVIAALITEKVSRAETKDVQ